MEINIGAGRMLGEHAVVLGGGIAGLLAAHVLSDTFSRVTLVERDRYSVLPTSRVGAPQSQHVHLLLARGAESLEEIFPGFGQELLAHGAAVVDFTEDVVALMPFGWLPRIHSNIKIYGCSRALIEWLIRRRVSDSDRLHILDGHQVIELELSPDGKGVCGVCIRPAGSEGPSDSKSIQADLVVDATGRGSRAPAWLEALGFGEVQEKKVDPFIAYATQQFSPPEGRLFNWKLLSADPISLSHRRGATIFPIEGGVWMVLLVGMNHAAPPKNSEEFIEFSKEVATPLIYEALKDAKPLSPVYVFRNTANRLRHYEKMRRWPQGFIVLGDAVCSINPLYGQGMTVCALGAQVLRRELTKLQNRESRDLSYLTRRFQKELANIYEMPWILATSEDKRWPETDAAEEKGKFRFAEQLISKYMNSLMAHIPGEPLIAKSFFEVIHLLRSPSVLFHPKIVAKTLFTRPRVDSTLKPTQPPTYIE